MNPNSEGFKFHYYALLVLTIAVVGFSYRLGVDTDHYMYYFDHYVDPDIKAVWNNIKDARYEPIPVLVFSLCKSIIDDFALVQFVIAAFVNVTVFWFLRKYSKCFFFSVFVYFIFQFWNLNFEIKRESIAIAFFLIGFDNILNNEKTKTDYLKYFLWCIPAMLSHRYAFIVLFMPLFKYIRLNTAFYTLLAILSGAIFLKVTFIAGLLSSVNTLFELFGATESVNFYLSSSLYGSGELTIFGYIESILLPLIVLYGLRNDCRKEIFGMALAFVLMKLLMAQVFIFYRLGNYLCFFLYIAYADAFYLYKDKAIKQIYSFALLCIVLLLFRGKIMGNGKLPYYPYNSIFTKEYVVDRENLYQMNY